MVTMSDPDQIAVQQPFGDVQRLTTRLKVAIQIANGTRQLKKSGSQKNHPSYDLSGGVRAQGQTARHKEISYM